MADSTTGQVSDGANADDRNADDRNADNRNAARIVAALRKAHAEQAAATGHLADSVAGPGAESAADLVAATAADPVADLSADLGSDHGSDHDPGARPGGAADPARVTSEAGSLDAPAPRRASTGVRPAAPSTPTLRWNPGARYRASQLASAPVPHGSVPPEAHGPVPPPPAAPDPVPAPPTTSGAVPPPPTTPGPVPAPPALAGRLYRGPARRTGVFEREIWYPAARSSRVPRDVGEALVAAVERYRKGSISTSGLVRAIGKAHAA